MQLSLQHLLIVFLGGGIGSVLRFIGSSVLPFNERKFWASTAWINLIGCLFIFLFIKLVNRDDQNLISKELQLFVKVGLLGGLTTFSTFSAELVQLFQKQLWCEFVLVLAIQIVGSLIMGILILKN